MNRAQLLILKNELDTDPLSRGYSAMTTQQKLDSVNAVDRNSPRTIKTDQVLEYMTTKANNPGSGNESVVSLLKEAAELGTVQGVVVTDTQRSACTMILEAVRYGRDVDFDVEDTVIVASFQAARDAGVFTTGMLSDIRDLATIQISRVQELGLPTATYRDIEVAEVL